MNIIDPMVFAPNGSKADVLGVIEEGRVMADADHKVFAVGGPISRWAALLEWLPKFRAAGLVVVAPNEFVRLTDAGKALLGLWAHGPDYRVVLLPPRPRKPGTDYYATVWSETVKLETTEPVQVHRMKDPDDYPEALVTTGDGRGKRSLPVLSGADVEKLVTALLSVTR